MGRKTQITRERILETALNMLLRDGYGAITVKTLAAEIGCSTQPILWHFDNMALFRREFYEYCIGFAKSRFAPWNGSLDDLLAETARGYITLACRMPNLFRFVFAESREDCAHSARVQKLQLDNTAKIMSGWHCTGPARSTSGGSGITSAKNFRRFSRISSGISPEMTQKYSVTAA